MSMISKLYRMLESSEGYAKKKKERKRKKEEENRKSVGRIEGNGE